MYSFYCLYLCGNIQPYHKYNTRQTDKQTEVIKPDDQATQHYLIVGECSKEQPVLQ